MWKNNVRARIRLGRVGQTRLVFVSQFLFLVASFSIGGCHVSQGGGSRMANSPVQPASMERILLAPDQRGFVTKESRAAFRPWGMNYGNDLGLMEDFWETQWDVLAT